MTKTQRANRERVDRALAWAQKQIKTAFHFTVVEMPRGEDVGDADHDLMAIDRSARGTADPDHFLVFYNEDHIPKVTMGNLRRIAIHEVIHARLWVYSEMAEGNKRLDEGVAAEMNEGITYWIQRLIVGDVEEEK